MPYCRVTGLNAGEIVCLSYDRDRSVGLVKGSNGLPHSSLHPFGAECIADRFDYADFADVQPWPKVKCWISIRTQEADAELRRLRFSVAKAGSIRGAARA